MRPYTICHMLCSVDGKIDGAALAAVIVQNEYEATGVRLEGDAWVCGRTTMERHFAEAERFVSMSNQASGPQPVHVAQHAKSYAIAIDTTGKLRWPGADLGGDHLICVVSERVAEDYLSMLRDKGISYIVAGESTVDLVKAVDLLGRHFGIRRLLLEGGGHINGAFLQADLVDEVSLLLVPGIDGRHEIPAVFDGVNSSHTTAVPLKLKSVEHREKDALWIRYDVVRT